MPVTFDPLAATGRKRHTTLIGIDTWEKGDGDPSVAYIVVQSGKVKAREEGRAEDVNAHYSANGLFTGATYAWLPGSILSGTIDKVVSDDAGTMAILYFA